MAGKTDQTKLQFLFKKLLGKANTSNLKGDAEEGLGSAVQLAGSQIFADNIPNAPTETLNAISSHTVEYLVLTATAVPGSTYDANDTGGGGDGSQAPGPHSYYFHLNTRYNENSVNKHRGLGFFSSGMALSASNGALQLVPPVYSSASPNPYQIKIYEDNGSGGLGDEISLLDEVDWYCDYYNGILFLQDYDSTKIPKFIKAFMYVGDKAIEKTRAVTVSGSYNDGIINKYLLLSGSGNPGNMSHAADDVRYAGDPLTYSDTSFFVSGSISSRGGNDGGTSTFGGDVALSGTLTLDNTDATNNRPLGINIINNSTEDRSTFDISLMPAAAHPGPGLNGNLGIIQSRGGGVAIGIGSGSLEHTAHFFVVTEMADPGEGSGFGGAARTFIMASGSRGGQVLILSGGGVQDQNYARGKDVSFYVSGSAGVRGTGADFGGMSVFGGDVLVSGTLYDSAGNTISAGGSPGGSNQQIQFNNSNAFGGSAGLTWDGTKVAISNTATTDSLLITTTEASADAGPVITLKRSTASPSDADAIGQIKFNGESDGDSNVTYAKITGKISNAADADEDGKILFTVMSAGGQTITSRVEKTGLTALSHFNLGLTSGDSGYGFRTNGGTVEWKNNGGSWAAISAGGGGGGGDSAGWIAAANQIISTTGSIYVGTANTTNPDINLGADGSAVFNEQGSSVDFRVESDNKSHAIFVDGSSDQVQILSNAGTATALASGFPDVSLFVSGAVDSKNSAIRGTTLFGGDVVTSGTLHVQEQFTINAPGKNEAQLSTRKVGITTLTLNGGATPTAQAIDTYPVSDSMAVKYFISVSVLTAGAPKGDRATIELLISNDGAASSANAPVFTENRAHTDYNVSNLKAGYLDSVYLPIEVTQDSGGTCTVKIKGSTYWLQGTGAAGATNDVKIRFERTIIRT